MTSTCTHFELFGDEPERLAEFYQETLGWQIEKMDGIAYWKVSTGGSDGPGLHGGLTHRAIPGLNGWLLHVRVDSLDETVERALKHGGTVVRPKTAVPRTAWVTILADPAKNIFGVWQADASAFPLPHPE